MQYPAAFIELKLVMAHSKLPDVFGTLVAQLKKYYKAAKAQHTPAMRVILFVWTEQAQHTVYEYLKALFNEEAVLKLEFAVVVMGHTPNERGEEMAEQSE
jgi:hypothetical protein